MTTIICDLDGVVWRGSEVIEGSSSALGSLTQQGFRLLFVTNNSFTPFRVIQKRISDIVGHDSFELVTSPVVSMHYINNKYPIDARLLVLGGPGLHEAIDETSITTVQDSTTADIVLVGLKPNLTIEDLNTAHRAISSGADFLAANDDPSYPNENGSLPGAGALVAALERSTGTRATVLGKPNLSCVNYLKSIISKNEKLVMIGDRLDQDYGLAMSMGAQFCLVLSGSTTREQIPPSLQDNIVVSADLVAVSSHLSRTNI